MTAQLINGKEVSLKIQDRIRKQVAERQTKGLRQPGLAVILVGDDPASAVYVRNKNIACEKVGFASFSHILPASTSEEELLSLVNELNNNPAVDGILVQLPLPKHINGQKITRGG